MKRIAYNIRFTGTGTASFKNEENYYYLINKIVNFGSSLIKIYTSTSFLQNDYIQPINDFRNLPIPYIVENGDLIKVSAVDFDLNPGGNIDVYLQGYLMQEKPPITTKPFIFSHIQDIANTGEYIISFEGLPSEKFFVSGLEIFWANTGTYYPKSYKWRGYLEINRQILFEENMLVLLFGGERITFQKPLIIHRGDLGKLVITAVDDTATYTNLILMLWGLYK